MNTLQYDHPCLQHIHMPLRPHQTKFIKRFFGAKASRGMVAAHGVGTGKTLVAVTITACFLLDERGEIIAGRSVVLVAPKSLVPNFEKELKAALPPRLLDAVRQHISLYTFDKFRLEMNVDAVPTTPRTLFIVDEAHNIRAPIPLPKPGGPARALTRAGAVVDFSHRAGVARVLLLTATPIVNEPYDVENLIAVCRRRPPIEKKRFTKIIQNRLLFKPYMEGVFDFYDAPQSLKSYPRVVEYKIDIEMTPSYFEEYARVERGISREIKTRSSLTFYTGVRQACNALTPYLKCNWIIDALETQPHLKTVVYSEYRTNGVDLMRDLAEDMIRARGFGSVFEIVGDMSQSERQEAVETFNARDGSILFITRAGGEGINLRGVRRVIFMEKGWNREREVQVIGRAVRFGSHTHLPPADRRVDVYHLVVKKPPAKKWKGVRSLPIDSADDILNRLIIEKEANIRGFKAAMIRVSMSS